MARPRKIEKKTKSYKLRLSEYEYDKLKFIAKTEGKSMSDILREVLDKPRK